MESPEQPDVASELADLAYEAGYGAAVREAEQAGSSEAAGDAIMDAYYERIASKDLWEPQHGHEDQA